jgi:hypothetical protein
MATKARPAMSGLRQGRQSANFNFGANARKKSGGKAKRKTGMARAYGGGS